MPWPRPPAGPASGGPPVVDLHKSWHMFHFLFTGRAPEWLEGPGAGALEGADAVVAGPYVAEQAGRSAPPSRRKHCRTAIPFNWPPQTWRGA